MKQKRKELMRRWRLVRPAGARLYWNHKRGGQLFDGNEIAVIRMGTLTVHFRDLDALEKEIAYMEGFL